MVLNIKNIKLIAESLHLQVEEKKLLLKPAEPIWDRMKKLS